MEGHDRPLLRLQAPEAALELIAIRQRLSTVLDRRLGSDHPNLRRQTTLVPTLVGACVDDEPMKPRVETVRIA